MLEHTHRCADILVLNMKHINIPYDRLDTCIYGIQKAIQYMRVKQNHEKIENLFVLIRYCFSHFAFAFVISRSISILMLIPMLGLNPSFM